jgi:glycosyltransferase involved in cell wall biosynthesis
MSLSVVIPAFDASGTLVETLDSVAAQTQRPSEVVVVDDGSTDETAEIAVRHSLGPKIIRQTNMGAAAAINRGVGESTGDWLAILDSDDLWDANWLAEATKVLAETNVDAVFGRMIAFLDPSLSPQHAARLHYQAQADRGLVLGACVLRRETFTTLGGLNADLRTGYFIDFYHRFLIAGMKGDHLSHVGLHRRIREGSFSRRAIGSSGCENRLAQDFVQIARAAIARKRSLNGTNK